MDARTQRVRLETERHRILGTLTLPPEGYRSRLTDLLSASDGGFLALTEASVEEVGSGRMRSYPYVAVSSRHVVFAAPEPGEPATGTAS